MELLEKSCMLILHKYHLFKPLSIEVGSLKKNETGFFLWSLDITSYFVLVFDYMNLGWISKLNKILESYRYFHVNANSLYEVVI